MKSRVQTLWIPDMESYEPYIRSLCHMARALENNGLNYGKMKRVVFIGLSKRVTESYAKQLLNANTLPNTLVCFGIDEPPVSHNDFFYTGAHVVLMHDLIHADSSALEKISQRLTEIILSLKQRPEDKEMRNGALSLVYQNPQLWSYVLDNGAAACLYTNRIQYAENLISSVGVEQLMSCSTNEDYAKLHALTITIGQEFFHIKPDALLAKICNLKWSLAADRSEVKAQAKIVLHDDFRRVFFEEYLLRDFQGF